MLDRAEPGRRRRALVAARAARRLGGHQALRRHPARPRHLAQGPRRAAQAPRRGAGCSSAGPTPSARPRYEYVLTPKGFEFVDVLMAMAAWGDRWTAGEAGPPALRRHRACGQITQVELHCAACGEILTSADVDVEAGPGAVRPQSVVDTHRPRHMIRAVPVVPEEGVMSHRSFRMRSLDHCCGGGARGRRAWPLPAQAAPRPPAADQRVDVYTGEVTAAQFSALAGAGVDQADVRVTRASRSGAARVEVTITGVQARKLARQGIVLRLERVGGPHGRPALGAAPGDASSGPTAAPAASRRSCSRWPRPIRRSRRRSRSAAPPRASRSSPCGSARTSPASGTGSARPWSTRPRSTRASGSRPRWSAGSSTTTWTTTAPTRR